MKNGLSVIGYQGSGKTKLKVKGKRGKGKGEKKRVASCRLRVEG